MGKAERKITKVVTDEGILLYRRVTEVIMPNGKRRYPVDYFDATPGKRLHDDVLRRPN